MAKLNQAIPAASARVVVVLMVVVRRGAGRRLVGLLGECLVVRRGVEPRIRAVRRGGLRVGRGGGADRDQQRCGTGIAPAMRRRIALVRLALVFLFVVIN